jgi:hypothetical protein
VTLNIACYYDSGPDTTPATVDGYRTDPTHFVRIYTPHDTSTECNQSQRHNGRWDTTAYHIEAPVTVEWHGVLDIMDAHVRVEGLQLEETTTDNGLAGFTVLYVREPNLDNPLPTDIRVSHTIMWNASTVPTPSRRAVFYSTGTGAVAGNRSLFWNNLLFSTSPVGHGIRLSEVGMDLYFYNNTVANFGETGDMSELGAFRLFKNNIFYGSGDQNLRSGYAAGSDYNWSSDSTSTGGAHDIASGSVDWAGVQFVDVGAGDFHLAPADAGATGHGQNLSADPVLPFATDIDGDLRDNVWDIGADEKQ